MKKIITISLFAVLLSSCCSTKYGENPAVLPQVDEVIEIVQAQYLAALTQLKQDSITDIEIKDAQISLKVEKSKSAEGGFTIKIFTPKASVTHTTSSTVTYSLTKKASKKGGAKPSQFVNPEQLKNMIVSSAKTFHNLKGRVGDLTKDTVELDLVFTIDYTIGVGFEFKFLGLGATAGVEKGNSVEHEIVLTFGEKE